VRWDTETNRVGEYETLQDLHQWKINHLRADQLSLTYSSEIKLNFNCQAFIPDVTSASISLLDANVGANGKGKGPTVGFFGLMESNLAMILKGKKMSLATVCPFFFSFFNHSLDKHHFDGELINSDGSTNWIPLEFSSTTPI